MMKTAKDLELSLLLKEKQIQDLKLEKIRLIENGLILRKRIDKEIKYIQSNEFIYNLQYEKEEKLLEILEGVNKDED